MESGRDNVEVKGAVKETVAAAVSATLKVEGNSTNVVVGGNDKQQLDEEEDDMGKQNGEELDEGAQERMLSNESAAKITSNEKTATEVKFISENGDAKIDIETIKEAISGMSKEELMKFANDPFWIKMRWALFILFWLLWAAMLAGAVAIIVMAPKCSAPEPKKIWEESAIVQLDPSDSPNNNLEGLESILYDLKGQHIKAISLSSLMKEDANGVVDFKVVKPEIGGIVALENLIKKAKDNDQQIFLELDPNHSSTEHPWFKQSVERQDPFTDYYVWADGTTSTDSGKERRNPPNNWLSIYSESAWEWNEQRGQYYLHQFNKSQPDLNYNNPAVVKEFGDILTHWLKLGISGFRLANTQYLKEDPQLHDEARSILPVESGNYLSLTHIYTRDRPENIEVLTQWQEIVHNKTDGKGLFSLQDDIGADILQVYNEKKTVIDLPQSSHFLTTANASINATVLRKGITQWLPIAPWPAWNLNGKQHALRQRMPAEIASSVTLMTMLLPGTPILRLNDTMSAKDAFATLSSARSSLTFLYGETTTRIVNGTVFVYARLKSGNPGYLVAYQTGDDQAVIDLSTIQRVSEEVSIFAHSPNYLGQSEISKTKWPSNAVPISPKSTVVLTFVPKE
ncbi:maltase 1-like isoform X2 [Pseudomyrmex gracilis]|uniref:maltase 1-like isoform X2 n=1 Tax=Pseudomyrmex gracilis TaxID=219809 RepID=UPI000995655B|nr:maltase 1-like isoform X2 [Pseudomyrmex gracilis]